MSGNAIRKAKVFPAALARPGAGKHQRRQNRQPVTQECASKRAAPTRPLLLRRSERIKPLGSRSWSASFVARTAIPRSAKTPRTAARSDRQLRCRRRERSGAPEGAPPSHADRAGQQRRHHSDDELICPAAEAAERTAHSLPGRQSRLLLSVSRFVRETRGALPRRMTLAGPEGPARPASKQRGTRLCEPLTMPVDRPSTKGTRL
jgi:hypothetical protein